jgi:hypothetical protein
MVTATQYAREAIRCDAAQYPFSERAAQHTAGRSPAARVPASTAEQLVQQTRLLLVYLGSRPGQVVGVL